MLFERRERIIDQSVPLTVVHHAFEPLDDVNDTGVLVFVESKDAKPRVKQEVFAFVMVEEFDVLFQGVI